MKWGNGETMEDFIWMALSAIVAVIWCTFCIGAAGLILIPVFMFMILSVHINWAFALLFTGGFFAIIFHCLKSANSNSDNLFPSDVQPEESNQQPKIESTIDYESKIRSFSPDVRQKK
jgi:hypothetical protein